MSRRRSTELFPTDGPIAPDRMIGRDEDVAALGRALENGQHRIVAGPRRTGKTTVCRAAMDASRERGWYTVELDLFGLPNAGSLAEALVRGTIANRGALRRALAQARELGGAALRAGTMRTLLTSQAELGEELEIAFESGLAARDPDGYLRFALALPQRVAAADDRQLILFLDEFQEIGGARRPYGDPDGLTKLMRSIFQESDRVTCLFAGSVEHLMRDLFAPSHRALFQFGGFHELASIGPGAWREGLRLRFDEDACELDEPGLRRLVELGERHPRTTMLIAQQTHVAAVTFETRRVDASLVEQGYAAARSADRPNHELNVQRLRSLSRHALEVAAEIARGESAYARRPARRAQRTVHALRDAGFAESPRRGEWRIVDPLLRAYLAEFP